jgi:hypothetical protein
MKMLHKHRWHNLVKALDNPDDGGMSSGGGGATDDIITPIVKTRIPITEPVVTVVSAPAVTKPPDYVAPEPAPVVNIPVYAPIPQINFGTTAQEVYNPPVEVYTEPVSQVVSAPAAIKAEAPAPAQPVETYTPPVTTIVSSPEPEVEDKPVISTFAVDDNGQKVGIISTEGKYIPIHDVVPGTEVYTVDSQGTYIPVDQNIVNLASDNVTQSEVLTPDVLPEVFSPEIYPAALPIEYTSPELAPDQPAPVLKMYSDPVTQPTEQTVSAPVGSAPTQAIMVTDLSGDNHFGIITPSTNGLFAGSLLPGSTISGSSDMSGSDSTMGGGGGGGSEEAQPTEAGLVPKKFGIGTIVAILIIGGIILYGVNTEK